MSEITAIAVMGRRCMRLSARTVDALLTSLLIPVLLMLMFVYLFGGALTTGTTYVTYVVPGVMILCCGFGAMQTATTVCQDLATGIVDRFRTLDVGGVTMLSGHVVASAIRNLVATVIVLGVALAIGFRPHATPAEWLAATGLLLFYVVAMSWAAAVVGLVARTPEAANGFTVVAMFLPYASSGFVPVSTMPSWLQGFARHQPMTPVIETLRALLLDRPLPGDAWAGAAWCAGILAVSIGLAAILFQRRTA